MIRYLLVCIVTCWSWNPSVAIVKLEANVTFLEDGNKTTAFFYCKAGQGQLYYLNHVLTWSKIGRDGRERYLSINWDLVQHGVNMAYHVETRMENISMEALQTNLINEPAMFILWKKDLVPSDHGEYICRIHDFDRNLLGQESVPVVVYEDGLAMSPYRVEAKAGRDIAINCRHNALATNGGHVEIRHVTKDGSSTRIVRDGKLTRGRLSSKYLFMTRDAGNGFKDNVLTLKNMSKVDEGHIVCDLYKTKRIVGSTNSTVSVDGPQLLVKPLYFLKVPHDADAHFKCECSSADNASCQTNQMWWSLSNQTTGEVTHIYKDNKLVGDPKLYEIVHEDLASTNLTIHGMKTGITEGDFVCSLHDPVTGAELSHASLPVSVIPISFRSMALMEKVNGIDNVRLLCILSGTTWDTHYFETHSIVWKRRKNGVTEKLAANNTFLTQVDKARYVIMFDGKHNYSILTITSVNESDYGDYICQLKNTYTKEIVIQRTLLMYGRGNTQTFGT